MPSPRLARGPPLPFPSPSPSHLLPPPRDAACATPRGASAGSVKPVDAWRQGPATRPRSERRDACFPPPLPLPKVPRHPNPRCTPPPYSSPPPSPPRPAQGAVSSETACAECLGSVPAGRGPRRRCPSHGLHAERGLRCWRGGEAPGGSGRDLAAKRGTAGGSAAGGGPARAGIVGSQVSLASAPCQSLALDREPHPARRSHSCQHRCVRTRARTAIQLCGGYARGVIRGEYFP